MLNSPKSLGIYSILQKEREGYEVIVEDGKFLYKQNRELLDSSEGPEEKYIFVLSTSKHLYVGQVNFLSRKLHKNILLSWIPLNYMYRPAEAARNISAFKLFGRRSYVSCRKTSCRKRSSKGTWCSCISSDAYRIATKYVHSYVFTGCLVT